MGISAGVINQMIKEGEVDKKLISDGYHTFDELYQHRYALFIALCSMIHWHHPDTHFPDSDYPVWRSKLHSDGTMFKESFIMGIGKEPGKMMTYHLPERLWAVTHFAETLQVAPPWDGHTSNDVIERLYQMVPK